MRKMHQKQALEFVKLLEQANKEIKTSIERLDITGAKGLLADCQDGAIQLGNLIEATEGEDFQGIPLIETYCELVYRIHEGFDGEEKADPGRIFKTLRQQLIKIENSIKNDVKIRKEVVFLPYKASMWDSLESVWKAADADPDCDAYVIPIPYYDKNPDGSFREMHYEGTQYPKDVPVVSYQDYDFEKRRPDVVFIHNPYDAENFVTSVHPDYYSGKLKEYTDKLVYIPYFVLNEIDPKDKAAVEEMKHFVLHAGVINADRVIVQSEKMRQIYIDVLSEAAGEQTRKVWEEKILGLGSPKFDKVVNAKVEERDIPKDWRKVIYRADGSRKKVILYNTSVAAFLKNAEQYFIKMYSVFDIFWQNRDKVALLWRPHPLMEATLQSMRPDLWRQYSRIVKKYRQDDWGIYDDSPELDRAIGLSDGYYGDQSSVVNLCQKAGIPVVVQSFDDEYLVLETFLDEGECFWSTGFGASLMGLFLIHKKTRKVEYKGAPVVPMVESQSFSEILKYRDKLYLIPRKSDYLGIYDIQEETWEAYPIEEPNKKCISWCYNKIGKFSHAFARDGMIYFIPMTYPAIMKFDTVTKKIEYLYECMESIKDIICKPDKNFCKKGFWQENKICFYSKTVNAVLQFDTKTCKLEVVKKLDDNLDYDIFEQDMQNGCYWLIPSNYKYPIVAFNNNFNIEKYHVNLPEKVCYGRVSFIDSLIAWGCLWLFPGLASETIKIDLKSGQAELVTAFKTGSENSLTEQWKYVFCGKSATEIYAFDGYSGELVNYDLEKGGCIKYSLKIGGVEKTCQECLSLFVTDAKFFGTTNTHYSQCENNNKKASKCEEIGERIIQKVVGKRDPL